MQRIILVYGSIAGVIVLGMLAVTMGLGTHGGMLGMLLGYLSMLIALSMVFVGVKRWRDEQQGGVIQFLPAFGLGMGIALVAAAFYVLGWEVYMWATDYSFASQHAGQALAAKRAAGASAADLAAFQVEMDAFAQLYAQPLARMAMTFSEIAPIALIVALISALLLRRPGFMPARV